MKVALKDIKSSKKRVRKTWDVDKLGELTRSIEEQGVLVPVKLRPTNDKYDIVFGHRRVAAAREAGLEEIEAIVEGVDDDTKFIQALTENVVREDMAALDIAFALRAIKETTGWTDEKLGEVFGWSRYSVLDYLGMLPFEDILKSGRAHVPQRTVRKVKTGVGATDENGIRIVLQKAVDEQLTSDQAQELGEEYARAKKFSKHAGEAVIEKPWLTSQPTTTTLEEEADQILRRKPVVLEKKVDEGEILFSWVKDVRVIRAEQALKDISSLVSIMTRSGDDPGGAKEMIKSLRKLAKNVVKQMDDVLKTS